MSGVNEFIGALTTELLKHPPCIDVSWRRYDGPSEKLEISVSWRVRGESYCCFQRYSIPELTFLEETLAQFAKHESDRFVEQFRAAPETATREEDSVLSVVDTVLRIQTC